MRVCVRYEMNGFYKVYMFFKCEYMGETGYPG